jgi:hypothetical protein
LVAQLPIAEAMTVHACAARELERTSGGDPGQAWTLADHLRRAGAHQESADYFERAGRHCSETYRHQRATSAFEAALLELDQCPAAEQVDQRRRIDEALGDGELLLREFGKASARYSEALALTQDNPVTVARLHRKLAAANQRDHAVALSHLKMAIAALAGAAEEQPGYRAEWLQARLDAMFVHYWRQETDELLAIAEEVQGPIEELGSADQCANFHFNFAAGLMQRHRYVTGAQELAHIDSALSTYAALGDRIKASMARFLRSMILLCAGDLDGAEAGFDALLALGEKSASVTVQLRALTYLSLVQRKRRAFEKVRRVARSTLTLAEEHDMPEYQGTALANLAWLALCDGEFEECERLAQAACEAWAASPLKYAFRWTALLPLLGGLLARPDGELTSKDLSDIAATLLQPTQELPPEALERELEALRDMKTSALDASRCVAERVVEVARRHGLL